MISRHYVVPVVSQRMNWDAWQSSKMWPSCMLRCISTCVHIASIHSENLSSHLSFHLIQDQSGKKPNPLKLTVIIKECVLVRVGAVGRYVLGRWLVLMLKRLPTTVCQVTDRGSNDLRYPRMSLSGGKFGAWVHSRPEPRQKWTVLGNGPRLASRTRLHPLSRWRPGGRDCWQNREAPPGGSEPQLRSGQPPWRVWLGSTVAVDGGQKTRSKVPTATSAFWFCCPAKKLCSR